MGMDEGQDWATDYRHPQALIATTASEREDFIVCLLAEAKVSHQIP